MQEYKGTFFSRTCKIPDGGGVGEHWLKCLQNSERAPKLDD